MLLPALEMLHRNVEISTMCPISAARFWSYDMPNLMCLQRVGGNAILNSCNDLINI